MEIMNISRKNIDIEIEEPPSQIYEISENFQNVHISINRNRLFISGMFNKIRIGENLGMVKVIGVSNELIIERNYNRWIELTGVDNNLIVMEDVSDQEHPNDRRDCCVVCLQEYSLDRKTVEILPCQHILHKTCFIEYKKFFDFCPICKQNANN